MNYEMNYNNSMYTHALRMTGNEHDAKDLFQEAHLRALEHNCKDQAQIYVIMKNLHIDNLRKIRTRNDFKLKYKPSESYIIDNIDFFKYIRVIRNKKNDLGKECFVMFLKGYTYQEIADKHNVNLCVVKSRIKRFRKRLIRNAA